MHFDFADVTGGEIVACVTALFTFLNLLFSGRAFQVARSMRQAINKLATHIGQPDPETASVSNGRTLTEEVESMRDILRTVVERDLLLRLQIESPGKGRRKANDDPGND